MLSDLFPAGRVRAVSSTKINRKIDEEMEASVERHARSPRSIENRLGELDAEWDMERTLEANAAALGLTGVLLAAFVDRRWLWLPGMVTTFLLQHALQGWCPPVEVFRRMGVRTRREIDAEKYALKALRGDFDGVASGGVEHVDAREALDAARGNRAG